MFVTHVNNEALTRHATRGPSRGQNPGHTPPGSPPRAPSSPPSTHGAGTVRGSAAGGASGSPPPPPGPASAPGSTLEKGREVDVENGGEKSSEHREDVHDPPPGVRRSGSPRHGERPPLLRAWGGWRVAPWLVISMTREKGSAPETKT